MRRIQLIISMLALSVGFGFVLAMSQSEPVNAGEGNPPCRVSCTPYVWCVLNEARCCENQVPCPNSYQYFRSYAHYYDIECEGPRNCGQEDIGCGPNCTLPDPPPDTL